MIQKHKLVHHSLYGDTIAMNDVVLVINLCCIQK